MPDISMCNNQTCPSKDTCYRFKAKPNEYYQSYTTYVVPEGKDKCEHYVPVSVRKQD